MNAITGITNRYDPLFSAAFVPYRGGSGRAHNAAKFS